MLFESIASALNLRDLPKGAIVGELRLGDMIDVAPSQAGSVWVSGTVVSGISAGKKGHVRRKWLIQHFEGPPAPKNVDRGKAANIVASRTTEFDAIHYDLGSKARTWKELAANDFVDCSGWVYLLGKEILATYGGPAKAKQLDTFSDEQICNCGRQTGAIVSGQYLKDEFLQPGMILGIDFGEYSWDRGRPLDIDHIVVIGADGNGPFVSQSSSSGGGVNRVPIDKWRDSQRALISAGRVHAVDLLAMV